MKTRELTGEWYLKKRRFGGFDVMVEMFYHGDGPSYTRFEKAQPWHFIKLDIKIGG